MNPKFLDVISTTYGLCDVRVEFASRGFVAETYVVQSAGRPAYFCKIIDKALWIPKVIATLPVLDAIHVTGFERASYPIKTVDGNLHVLVADTLIVVQTALYDLLYDLLNVIDGGASVDVYHKAAAVHEPAGN